MPGTYWRIWGPGGIGTRTPNTAQHLLGLCVPRKRGSYRFFRGMFWKDLEDTRMILEETEAGILRVPTTKCVSTSHQPGFGWQLTPRVVNSRPQYLPGCRQRIHSALVSPPSLSQCWCLHFNSALVSLPSLSVGVSTLTQSLLVSLPSLSVGVSTFTQRWCLYFNSALVSPLLLSVGVSTICKAGFILLPFRKGRKNVWCDTRLPAT